MNALLFASLWLHVAACSLFTGACLVLVLAGRPNADVSKVWEWQILATARWLAVVALASGLVWFALRVSTFTGRMEAAIDLRAIVSAAIDTRVGKIWLIRQSLLVIALTYLYFATPPDSRADWIASRWLVLVLSAVALALISLSGHAAAVPRQPLAHWADVLHLLSAGLWIGALPYLARLLFMESKAGETLGPYSMRALKRFSPLATVIIFALTGTGLVTASYLVGDFPRLVGTVHGRLLIAKVVVLVPALLLAARVRSALGEGRSGGAPLSRRLAGYVAAEAALVLLILGFAIAMILSIPGKHESPVWPFPIRYVPDSDVAGYWQALTSTQHAAAFAVIGMLALGALVGLRRQHLVLWSIVAGLSGMLAVASSMWGGWIAAYPTSYARSPVPYDVRAIGRGRDIWQAHCQLGAADMTGFSAAMTVGDYYWLSGHRYGSAEVFCQEIGAGEEDRWSLAQYLSAGVAASSRIAHDTRTLKPGLLPAPDFDIVLGPMQLGPLSLHRRGRAVLLVLYTLPQSQQRMEDLARSYAQLAVYNVEIVAVPRHASANPIGELQTPSPALFPIVTADNELIASAYDIFAPDSSHAEFLIDPRGHIRTIWRNGEWSDAEDDAKTHARRLLEEAVPGDADDHVH